MRLSAARVKGVEKAPGHGAAALRPANIPPAHVDRPSADGYPGRVPEEAAREGLFGVLWRFERPTPGVPAKAGILGGPIQRTVDYRNGTYTNRIFWVIPVRKGTFTPR